MRLLHYCSRYGQTPLTCAATKGHEAIVEYLLESYADRDGKFSEYEDRSDILIVRMNVM